MAPAPWDSVPAASQHFVLITGANSGVGLGICQRLIDDFLHNHPLTSHLILLPTTRSRAKSRETVLAIRRYLESVSRSSRALRARARAAPAAEHDYIWTDSFRRVHVLSPQLDLCDIPGVYAFAARLVAASLSNPPDEGGMADILTDVRVPRLDAVIFNAGYGGWVGFSWWGLTKSILTRGLVTSMTWPDYKIDLVGTLVPGRSRKSIGGGEKSTAAGDEEEDAALGAVFCSNVFGHYVLGHALLPLLSRAPDDAVKPGKIIWTSSLEAAPAHFRLEDIQGLKTVGSYEGSKRLTDLLALTSTLPHVRPYSGAYFRVPRGTAGPGNEGKADEEEVEERLRPQMYVTHPGIVVTTLFPVPAFLLLAYRFAMYLVRWIGSPWHNVDGYTGSSSPAWVALEDPGVLRESGAERTKWGSACDRLGRSAVKATEVEGWGWDGRVAGPRSDEGPGMLRRKVGRRRGAQELTKRAREEFEVLGAECWKEMERLRGEWEARLGVEAAGR